MIIVCFFLFFINHDVTRLEIVHTDHVSVDTTFDPFDLSVKKKTMMMIIRKVQNLVLSVEKDNYTF